MKDKKIYLEKANEKIQLIRSYKYFYRTQGEMFCTQLKRVDLAVHCGKNVPPYAQTVTFNKNFWHYVLPRIEFSFRRAAVPELFTRKVQRGEIL